MTHYRKVYVFFFLFRYIQPAKNVPRKKYYLIASVRLPSSRNLSPEICCLFWKNVLQI